MSAPARTNWVLVAALVMAGLFAAAQFGKLTLTLPALRQTYNAGGAFVPALISIVGIVGILLGAVAGSVVARLGVGRVLTAALLGGAALSLAQASLPGIWVFAGLRVLEGLSHLAIVVAAPTLIAAVSSEVDRPLAMGIWAAFFGISMAILAALLPVLLPLGGLRAVFIAHGAGMAVMALVVWPLLPNDLRAPAREVSYLGEHRVIYSTPRLLLPGAGFVWYTVIYIALLAVLPIALGLPVWAVTALPLVSITGTVLGGVLGRWVAPSDMVCLGFGLSLGAAGMVYGFAPAIWPLVALFFVMGLVPAGSFAAIAHFNQSVTDRARATGGLAQLGNVGTTLGTPLFVLAFEGGGIGAVCAVMALFCVFGIVSSQALRRAVK